MTTFSLTFQCDNAAFEDDRSEMAAILETTARNLTDYRERMTGLCRDANGNPVGGWSLTESATVAPSDLPDILHHAEMWIGKMIADGAHLQAVAPGDCVRTLQRIRAALETSKESV